MRGIDGVALPDVFEGFGQGLQLCCVVHVAGVDGENILVVIALCGEDFGHLLVGEDPVVHVVAHGIGVVEVLVADFHPDANGFGRRVGNEVLVELPCAVGIGGKGRPLLVDEGAGVREDAVIPLGVKPGHDQRAGCAGAAAHGGAAVGVMGELDVGVGFDEGKDFILDPLGVETGHGVVFQAALAALGVSAAVGDGDGDYGGEFALGDEVVEDGEESAIGTVGADDEGSCGAGDVLRGDVDGDAAGPGGGMAGGDEKFGRIGGVGGAVGVGVAGDAG